METIILSGGKTIRDKVHELGFHLNEYFAEYKEHKLVWKGNCWMEV